MREMDEKYCVVQFSNKTRIFTLLPSTIFPGSFEAQFFDKDSMNLYFANQFVVLLDGKGKPYRQLMFPFWLQREQRPSARGLVFDTSTERIVNGHLNLWTGFSVQPKEGDWSLIKRHISEVICDGDKELAQYIFKWLAWVIQNPCLPAEVAVVIGGKKGAGKGTIIRLVRDIFGMHGVHISNSKHLIGAFNGHLLHCCFLFVDEALWPGENAATGVLNRMVTEPTLSYEPKGLTVFEAMNKLSIMLASNEGWIVPATDDERRYACCTASNKYLKNVEYFTELTKQINGGGKEAFLHAMLNLDLDGWHPRYDVPDNDALRAQVRETASPEVQWLWQILEEGAFPAEQRMTSGESKQIRTYRNPRAARTSPLYEHFKASDPRLRYHSLIQFKKFIGKVGVVPSRDKNGSLLVFPVLSEARAALQKEHPHVEQFTPGMDDWSDAHIKESKAEIAAAEATDAALEEARARAKAEEEAEADYVLS